MPQLLRNIHGIIEAFGCYARSEGGCKVLTKQELKRLLEYEFADVIVKPHDPATVDEVLHLLDEDNTGTVEFKEFLVLVFKVARACFKTLNESPKGACMSDKSESCHVGSSKELEQGQRGGAEVAKDGAAQHCENSSCGQRDQASRGQDRVGTHTQHQDSYPTWVSSHDRQAESQTQEMISQQTQVTGPVEQTPKIEDKSCIGQKRSERQPQISQQTDEITTESTTQTQAGTFYTQGSTCDQNRGTNSLTQDRSQTDQASTQHYQTRAGSHTQIHNQTVEQGWGQQTGKNNIQIQGSIYDQSRETEIRGQDRNQASQTAKEHHQAQAESYTRAHTQTMEQGRSQQEENGSIQTHASICGQNRGTKIHEQESNQVEQVGTGHCQTQAGSDAQTLEHNGSHSARQVVAQEKGQMQTQSCMGQSWTPVSNYETGEPVLGQVQTEIDTVKERQPWNSNHPSLAGRQGERSPTVVREEWVNDHTREIVIRSQDPGSLHSGAPSAQGQDTAQMEKKGITAKGLYSYLKTEQP
ncbi:cornulin isoform X1 [Rattus norvegicus]|uniref:Cornulin n=1 Tax=Rattus norvegicus TaxID=10116 RepID=D3ZSW4_RAT|eukprot:XP_008759485.1 PREDICTED: cornulin isoform X2 [Rattus norvegicus]